MQQMNSYTESDYINDSARLIEMNLEAFGIFVKVVEINILKDFYEYYLETAVGTDLHRLEKHGRDLALASPTGKVHWQIPVPGTTYAGLKVPKPSKEYFESRQRERDRRLKGSDWKSRIAFMFFLIGQANFTIAHKLLGKPEANSNIP